MSLAPGVRLGPYEIVGALGAGGMGEVYKARDTRLDRTVAIKVLPSHVASDPQARERFEREARAVGALNHPNVCTLHDIGRFEPVDGRGGSSGAIDVLVLEYIEGETLASRLGRGALPLPQALVYAGEIASALDRAHRAGIVHRDIKPGNLMVTPAGLKLLDFGLAKTSPLIPIDGVTTEYRAADLTERGVMLGTVQYMAPEQIEGGTVDARTDIFALGVVLYEMVTGRKAFEGGSRGSVMAAILERDPPSLTAVSPQASAALEHVIATCLAKAPDDRWQSARDVLLALRGVGDGRARIPGAGTRRSSRGLILGALGLVSALAVAVASPFARPDPPAAETTVLDIVPPPDTSLLTSAASIPAAQFAVSSNGRYVVFVAAESNGQPQLWLRELASGTTERLPLTEGASYPFWSGDSANVGFFAAGKLKRMDLDNRNLQIVCDAVDARGGTWNGSGVIVFALGNGGLLRVSAAGGSSVPVTTLDTVRGDVSHRWPSFLPDGRRFTYVTRGLKAGLHVGSIDGSTNARIDLDTIFAGTVAAGGRLVYVRNRALVVQAFDADRAMLSGEPLTLAPRVGTASTGYSAFSLSSTGVLVYAGDLTSPGHLTWFDRQGRVIGTVGGLADHMDFELSPNGRRVLDSRVDPTTSSSDVWLVDLTRGVESRVTTDPGIDASAAWDPTGTQIVFRSNREGLADAWIKSLGSEPERLLFKGTAVNVSSWSPDGQTLLYNESRADTGWDIWRYSLADGQRTALVGTASNELHGRYSPDGKWVAYSSDESGQWQVYVRSTVGLGERVTLSTSGGFEPRWRGDGRELYYLTPERQIAAVELRFGAGVEPGSSRRLFDVRIDALPPPLVVSNGYRKTYTVTPDGQRFLVNVLAREQNTQAMSVMLNWPARLGNTR